MRLPIDSWKSSQRAGWARNGKAESQSKRSWRMSQIALLALVLALIPQAYGQSSLQGLVNGGVPGTINTPGTSSGKRLFQIMLWIMHHRSSTISLRQKTISLVRQHQGSFQHAGPVSCIYCSVVTCVKGLNEIYIILQSRFYFQPLCENTPSSTGHQSCTSLCEI